MGWTIDGEKKTQGETIEYIKNLLGNIKSVEEYFKKIKTKPAPKPPLTPLERESKNIIAYAFQDHVRNMRAMGWDFGQIIRDYNAEAKRARVEFAKDMKQLRQRAEQDAYYAPDNLHLLDSMFKFDKKHKRHY